jgi:hypothetical protein
VLSGCIGSWKGLPPDLRLDALRAALDPVVEVHPDQPRVRGGRRYTVTPIDRAAPPRRTEAWVLHGETSVSIVELDDPSAPDELDAVLECLGPPELTQTDRRFAPGLLVRDLVFAGGGLMLSVGEPLTGGAPGTSRVLVHVRLFVPRTIESYLTDIDDPAAGHPQTSPQNRP